MQFHYKQSFFYIRLLILSLSLTELSHLRILQQKTEGQEIRNQISIRDLSNQNSESIKKRYKKSEIKINKNDSKSKKKGKLSGNQRETNLSSKESLESQIINKNTIRYINSHVFTKEKVRDNYLLEAEVNYLESRSNLNSFTYKEKPPHGLFCEDHVKYMYLDYSCIEKLNERFIRPVEKNLFIVQSKNKKYFLRIQKDVKRYEISLEKSMKINAMTLNLLEHKVYEGHFAGIYRYEENQGVLDFSIKTNKLSYFDKLNYMLRISKGISMVLKYRNKQNMALKLNIHPQNILLTNGHKYAYHLISALPTTEIKEESLETLEDETRENFPNDLIIIDRITNIESETIYNLGKLFYFMLFKVYPKKKELPIIIEDLDKFIRTYNKKKNFVFLKQSEPNVFSKINSQIVKNNNKSSKKLEKNSLEDIAKNLNEGNFRNSIPSKEKINKFISKNLELENEIFQNINLKVITMIRMMLLSRSADRPDFDTIIHVLNESTNRQKFFFNRIWYGMRRNYDNMTSELRIEILNNKNDFFKSSIGKSLNYQRTMFRKFEDLKSYRDNYAQMMSRLKEMTGNILFSFSRNRI